MKRAFFASVLISLACVGAFAAAPMVEVESIRQAANRDVTVSYTLFGASGFVTAEILTNGAPAGVNVATASGDINAVVAPGARSFVWKARKDWPDQKLAVSVQIKALPVGHMPDYMVVDLLNPDSRSFYATSNDVPGGVTSRVYKTDKLIMRRIPARGVIWRMGQPAGGELCQGESRSDAPTLESTLRNNETGHRVALTEDYYMSIYEVTQQQYYNMTGLRPSSQTAGGVDASGVRPVDSVSVHELRGAPSGSFVGWPANGHAVADGSVLKTLRDFTGIESFDLPTEAQWEYACRAGTTTSLNSGKDVLKPNSGNADANFAEVGWSQVNGGVDNTSKEVGLLMPNRWGLYDMHGNIAERCLDWQSEGDAYRATFAAGWTRGAVTVDPVGPATGTYRIVRGGDHRYSSSWARSAARAAYSHLPDAKGWVYGIRLVCSAAVD